MYNPYENNNQNTPETPAPKNGGENYGPVYGSQNGGSYSWGTPQQGEPGAAPYNQSQTVYPPVSYGQPPAPKPPKKKKGWGKQVLTIVLCCLISSAVTLGALTAMIGGGVISLGEGEKAAFTINKVVDGGTAETSGEVGVLTPQEISEKLIPSVVCIQNYQIQQRYGGFMGTDTDNSEVSPVGEGSGIVYSQDGYIITNAHVVAGATSLKVILSDGQTYEAQLVGADEVTDLAVLKIEATDLTPAEFGSADDLKIADQVLAVGNPGGMSFNSSVTVGYISGLNREITNGSTGYTMYCIQTDAAINPGNSGGALVNRYGQVVGVNSAKIADTNYEGLGFAIPSETFQPIVSDLMNYGYVKDRAVLGISGRFIDAMTASFYGLTPGMFVSEITQPAAQSAGLQKGDVITSIDGVQVTTSTTITSVVTTKKPGEKVKITVDRALEGKSGIELEVTLSQYEQPGDEQPQG